MRQILSFFTWKINERGSLAILYPGGVYRIPPRGHRVGHFRVVGGRGCDFFVDNRFVGGVDGLGRARKTFEIKKTG
jgi:hypothetical protein